MKSGLEDRNNLDEPHPQHPRLKNVSMKSGLEDRNNLSAGGVPRHGRRGLNEVRPGRPEQCRRMTAITLTGNLSQ